MVGRLRRIAWVLPLALLLLLLARWGKPRVVAPLAGTMLAPPVDYRGQAVWLERRTDGDHLLRQGKSLLSSPSLGGLALVGPRAITSVSEAGGAARLLALDLETGTQQQLAPLSAPARALAADARWIAGLSGCDPALPSVPFVVAAGPSAALWAKDERADRPTVVAEILGSVGTQIDLLGLVGGDLYWMARGKQGVEDTTTISRAELASGLSEVVVTEPGYQSAVLLPDRLAWTCYSREADDAAQYRAVRTRPLAGGSPRLIADWLAPSAQLLASGQDLYAQETGTLWWLGQARGDQRVVFELHGQAVLPAVVGGAEYLVEGYRAPYLAARGLSWPAKLRLALGM